MPAKFPQDRISWNVKSLPSGERGFAPLDGLMVDSNGETWLHPDYPVVRACVFRAALEVFHSHTGYQIRIPDGFTVERQEPDPSIQWVPVQSINNELELSLTLPTVDELVPDTYEGKALSGESKEWTRFASKFAPAKTKRRKSI